MPFISVVQGRTCRYSSKTSFPKAEGVYTDDFSDCNIIIIYGENADEKRISMTHADKFTMEILIKAEIEWVGANAKIKVLARDTPESKTTREAVIPSLLNQCEIISINNTFGLSFDKNFISTSYMRDSIPELIVHPDEWKAHSVYWINTFLEGNTSPSTYTTILYDGESWAQLNPAELELGGKANKILSNIIKEKYIYISNAIIYQTICATLDKDVPRENKGVLSSHFSNILHNGDYKKIFKSEINLILNDSTNSINQNKRSLLAIILKKSDNDFDAIQEIINSNFSSVDLLDSQIRGHYKSCTRKKKHTNPTGPVDLHAYTSSSSSNTSGTLSNTTRPTRTFVEPEKKQKEQTPQQTHTFEEQQKSKLDK